MTDRSLLWVVIASWHTRESTGSSAPITYDSCVVNLFSGAGTNLKVGAGAPVQSKSGEHRSGAFLVVPLHFLALKVQLVVIVPTSSACRDLLLIQQLNKQQIPACGACRHYYPISRFGTRFRDGQYSLVSFLSAVLLLTVPPCPAICRSGARAPRAPWSRRHWTYFIFGQSIRNEIVYIKSQLSVPTNFLWLFFCGGRRVHGGDVLCALRPRLSTEQLDVVDWMSHRRTLW